MSVQPAALPALKTTARPDEIRLAAIDVGTNSIHMVIAQVGSDGGVTTLWRMKEMLGLGRMSFPSHRLSAEAMDRAIVTLRRFCQEAQRRQCEHILAVATSAVREAENGGDFIERARRELDLHVRVVSAKDEARLIYLGVRHAMDLRGGPHLLIDVGGGSVEFIVADAEGPLLLESRKLGAARMTAKYIKSDPISAADRKALLAHYQIELEPLAALVRELKPVRTIGTSGTIENLAAMANGGSPPEGSNPPVLRRDDLSRILDKLLESRSEDRARMKGLDDKRRDQIVAGALLVDEIFRRMDIRRLDLCNSALREGLVIDFLARHRPQMQVRREIPDPRRRAIIDLARRCHWHREHSEQVARLCLRLFDQLKPLHRLGRRDRELIEYGALLHDIGSLIGQARHHKHSMYLILNGDLQPFDREEVRVIANIARYHRKAPPRKSHPRYAELPREAQRAVRVGAALLRIADGLDRTNCGVVANLHCRIHRRSVDVFLDTRGDAELETWSARSRSKLFSHVFHRSIEFHDRPR